MYGFSIFERSINLGNILYVSNGLQLKCDVNVITPIDAWLCDDTHAH